ncbi:retinol dehydrogenase 13-like [Liolophura sinensis]|uniref:retinol dehydrogenase 13-like n=1 Tax=Liolophura sinensis TaxID=3198878 RepID=UPI003158DFED
MSGKEKVVIVTGANSGLGFAVSQLLCAEQYDVILACRSEKNGNDAVAKIIKEFPEAKATFMQLDLADMSSIRGFVEKFLASGKPLDILINNAGLSKDFADTERHVTKDNFEMTMGTNHLGHFLLTNLLLPALKDRAKETQDIRIVVVTSGLHDIKMKGSGRKELRPMSLDNLMLDEEGTYNGGQAYKDSKLANILFTYELARQLEGTGLTVNCLCPGFIPDTNFIRNANGFAKFMLRTILKPIFWLKNTTRTVEQGATAIKDLATNESLKGVSGKYFRDMKEAVSSEESQDMELQKGLWAASAKYCELETTN